MDLAGVCPYNVSAFHVKRLLLEAWTMWGCVQLHVGRFCLWRLSGRGRITTRWRILLSMYSRHMLPQIIKSTEIPSAIAMERPFSRVLSNMSGKMFTPGKLHRTFPISSAHKHLV